MAGPSVVGGDDGPRRGISHMRTLLYSARGRCTHLVEEERTKAARVRRREHDVGGAATGRPSRPGEAGGEPPATCKTMNTREGESESRRRYPTGRAASASVDEEAATGLLPPGVGVWSKPRLREKVGEDEFDL